MTAIGVDDDGHREVIAAAGGSPSPPSAEGVPLVAEGVRPLRRAHVQPS